MKKSDFAGPSVLETSAWEEWRAAQRAMAEAAGPGLSSVRSKWSHHWTWINDIVFACGKQHTAFSWRFSLWFSPPLGRFRSEQG